MEEISLYPRHMFLWSMAMIYMFAFASLYMQIPGLYGEQGVVPVHRVDEPGDHHLLGLPFLLWRSLRLDGQQLMELFSLLGALLALATAVLASLRNSLVYFLLWSLYLSLCQVDKDFLRLPWDSLLLEAGFLTILIAPLNLLGRCATSYHPNKVTFWLARWLLFRLTFGSGVAKLASYSPSWWGLTAVSDMLEAQGSPTPLAWFAYQLPDWLLSLATVAHLVSETVVPVFYFAEFRRLRLGAFYIQLVSGVVSMLVTNVSVVTLLSMALSFSLLDDEHVRSWLAHGKKRRAKTWSQTLMSWLTLLVEAAICVLVIYGTITLFQLKLNWEAKTISSKIAFSQQEFTEVLKLVTVPSIWIGVLSLTWELVASMLDAVWHVRGVFWKLWALLQWFVFGAAAVALFTLSVVPYTSMEPVSSSRVLPEVRKAYSLMEPYRLVSSYALSGTVRQDHGGRPEVVLEGSMDNTTWKEIQWMYRPGKVDVAPPVVAPYQARLDWLMWQQAAQAVPAGRWPHGRWFTGLVQALLQGKRDVVGLLQKDQDQYPFSKAPPTYLRASLYKYHFTGKDEDESSPKQWWRRDVIEEVYPTVRLGDATLEGMLTQHGLNEAVQDRSDPDSPLVQVLKQLRGHVQDLPGPLMLQSLFAAVATVCLLRSLLSWDLGSSSSKRGGRQTEPKTKRSKEQQQAASTEKASGHKGDATTRQESDKSPKKRK